MNGNVSLYYNSGSVVVEKPDGTFLNVAGSTTCGFQEAFNYATPLGLAVFAYGRGKLNPFRITDSTINVPASDGVPFYGFNCWFEFSNHVQDGIVFDTRQKALWDNRGGGVRYSGTGRGVVHRPVTPLHYSSGAPNAPWSVDSLYDLGHVEAIEFGLTSEALQAVELTVNGTDQYTASGFVNNVVRTNAIEAFGFSHACFRYYSPTSANQCGGENLFDFGGQLQGALDAEISIGTSAGALDGFVATNEYVGNIAHVVATGVAITSDTKQDRYRFRSINAYSPGPLALIVWGPQADNNLVETQQCYGGGQLELYSPSRTPTNTVRYQGVYTPTAPGAPPPPPPPPSDTDVRTTGTTDLNCASGTWTYVDRSFAIPNGKTVTKLHLYAPTAGSFPLKLLRRNSAGNYDVVVDQTVSHTGSGWEVFTLTTPYTVPADGKGYYVGVFTPNVVMNFIDFKDRTLTASNVIGSGVTMTEQASQAGWYVVPVGATYH